jgi:ribosomal protein L14
LFSVRKGMSSERVRSSPSAEAIVLRRLIEFRRRCGSSFLSSSLRGGAAGG